MVQSSGMNWPVESQNGAMPPLASSTGIFVAPKSVPALQEITLNNMILMNLSSTHHEHHCINVHTRHDSERSDCMKSHVKTNSLTQSSWDRMWTIKAAFWNLRRRPPRGDAPEVPRETTQSPSLTAPAPSALIWLSPLPGATATSSLNPSSAAISGRRCPTTCPAFVVSSLNPQHDWSHTSRNCLVKQPLLVHLPTLWRRNKMGCVG